MSKMKLISLLLAFTYFFCIGAAGAKTPSYRVILDCQYDMVSHVDDNSYAVLKGNTSGIFDQNGKPVLKMQTGEIYGANEGMFTVYRNKKFGLMDRSGNMIVTPKYEMIDKFWEGLAGVRINHKMGCIDKKGNEVIKPQWDFLEAFSSGVACVMVSPAASKVPFGELVFYKGISGFGKWGLIDKTGKVLMTPKWDYAAPMIGNDKLIIISKKNGNDYKEGIADITGKVVIQPVLDAVTYFRDGMELSPVKQNGKWAFMNRSGKIVTKFEWDEEPTPFSESNKLWQIAKKSDPSVGYSSCNYGIADDAGSIVFEPKWKNGFYFYEGVSEIEEGEHNRGFIDDTGRIIAAPQWRGTKGFSDGIAWVYGSLEPEEAAEDQDMDWDKYRTCWRAIDRTGSYISLTGWDKVASFKNGYAAVSNEDGKSTIIDKNMNPVCTLDYEVTACLSGSRFIFVKNDRYGLVDSSGKVIYAAQWESVDFPEYLKRPDLLKMTVSKSSWSGGYQVGLLGNSDKLIGNKYWGGYRDLHDQLLQVVENGQLGLLNMLTGTLAVPPQYSDMYYLGAKNGESIWETQKGNKFGVIAVKIP